MRAALGLPVLPLFLIAGCSDSGAATDPVKAQQETASTTSKVAQVLKSVQDSESAKRAKAELQQLAGQVEAKVAALKQSWTGDKGVKETAKDWLDKARTALSTESRQAFAQVRSELERIQQNPPLQAELHDVIERVKAALAGL